MTPHDQLAPRNTKSARHRARGATHRPAREARARRSFDSVVASYIRELSAADDATPRPTAGHGPQGS